MVGVTDMKLYSIFRNTSKSPQIDHCYLTYHQGTLYCRSLLFPLNHPAINTPRPQIPADMMTALRDALRNMRDFRVPCGPAGALAQPDETVLLTWTQDDTNFNVG